MTGFNKSDEPASLILYWIELQVLPEINWFNFMSLVEPVRITKWAETSIQTRLIN